MRRVLAIVLISVVLAGCGNATAAEPDSRNPVHCAAALNMAAVWNESDIPSAHPDWAPQFRAHALYEIEKIRESGLSDKEAKAKEVAFTKDYWKDDRMAALAVECVRHNAQDPRFRAERRRLMASVSKP